jgi:PST family polysaccharide transporter
LTAAEPGEASRLKSRAVGGFVSLSLRQVAGVAVAAVGSIVLARQLGAQPFGAYAVFAFFNGLLAIVLDSTLHVYVIRAPREELNEALIRTVFGLRLLVGVSVLLFVALALGPALAWWYQDSSLYWLLAIGVGSAALASPLRLSLSLLERDMDYARVSAVELAGTTAFFLSAAVCAVLGGGIWALIVGELFRASSAVLAYALRPFRFGLGFDKPLLSRILGFAAGYLGSSAAWLAASGVNPLVVAKLAGLEAAGFVRIAEGIIAQASFLKVVGDRVSFPMLAEIQTQRQEVARSIASWRLYQLLLGITPLMLFTAVSDWLVPALYGAQWSAVAPLLRLLALGTALNTLFSLYSAALVAVGKNWQVARFNAAYSTLVWLAALLLVPAFGSLGYGFSVLAAAPAYWLIQRSFRAEFGATKWLNAALLVAGSWLSTFSAVVLPHPVKAAAAAVAVHVVLVALIPELRSKTRTALSVVLGPAGRALRYFFAR